MVSATATDRRFPGARVVVAGASSGIGLATARLFAREGATVALLARSESGLDAAAAQVREDGGRPQVFACDVSDRAAAEEAIGAAAGGLGGIDVLVSAPAALAYGSFSALEADDFDRSFDVTFRGVANAVRAALPHLERSGGTLVAVVSMASKIPIPLHSPYVAAKHALRGFLGSLRVELRHQRSAVRVCMVHPGFIGTPFFEHSTSAVGTQPHPLRSVYRAEVVAAAVLECVRKPRAEVTVGGSAAALNLLHAVARPLSDRLLSTYGVWGQRTELPAADRGMLWRPSGEGRVRGRYRGRPSVWTALRLRSPRALGARALDEPSR